MGYSVILPTLNEAGHIVKLVEKINTVFFELSEKFEIIIVDDNSTDGTERLCNEMTRLHKNLKFFSRKGFKKNLANSINLGIKQSIYENIIWMDADFQHPPRYIREFIDLSKHKDVIVCSRFLKQSERYFNDKKINKVINENQSQIFNKLCNFLF